MKTAAEILWGGKAVAEMSRDELLEIVRQLDHCVADAQAHGKFGKAGANVVFVCERCGTTRLTLPADNHDTLDSAYERAREWKWTFQEGHGAADDLVVCPRCSKVKG
jgi:hypothetical protein